MTRKSKREIEHALDELGAPVGEYPKVTLCELFSCEWEDVDGHPELQRRKDTGEIYHFPEDRLAELWEEDLTADEADD